MKKKLLTLAIASACVASGSAFAANMNVSANVNGFVDTNYVITDEAADDTAFDATGATANPNTAKFNTNGEVDFMAGVDSLTVRVDLDATTDSTSAVSVEQAFGRWGVTDAVNLTVGQFNNPMGYEGEDITDISTITHSLVWGVLAGQTANDEGANSNSVRGAAVDFNAGPAMITVGLVNDLHNANDTNSFLLNIGGEVIPGLTLELGTVTQEDQSPNTTTGGGNPNSYESLTDFNAAYGMGPWKVWVDYLTAGKTVDSVYSVGGKFDFGNGIGATARYDTLSYENSALDDYTSTTLAVSWQAQNNLDFRGEWQSNDAGGSTGSNDLLQLEALFTF